MHTFGALWRLYSGGDTADDLKHQRPSTQDAYAGIWRRDLEPRFAARGVASITSVDLRRCTARPPGAPATTRRTGRWRWPASALAGAVKAGWRPDNPARAVRRHHEPDRERYLSPEEIEKLVGVLDARGDLAARCWSSCCCAAPGAARR